VGSLELKVPPPLAALITGAAMWWASGFVPSMELPSVMRMAAAMALAGIGLGFDAVGIASFLRARTTVNPMSPDRTSSLVSSGVYRITRNPMYLGMLFLLSAWAVFLSSAWLLAGPLAFMLYITRFQIAPEERMLHALFGDAYAGYAARVRRWL
jgi:protein-S-isoprenylcysteine O-methyltransferase Ste14